MTFWRAAAFVGYVLLLTCIFVKIAIKLGALKSKKRAAPDTAPSEPPAPEPSAPTTVRPALGCFCCKVAGVIYKNEDGSKRQNILKAYYNTDTPAADFKLYDYRGNPAALVLIDGKPIGNIPRDQLDDFLRIYDRITTAAVDVDRFVPDDAEDDRHYIYRADLTAFFER